MKEEAQLPKWWKRNRRRRRKAERTAQKCEIFSQANEWQVNLIDRGKGFEIYIQCNLYNRLNVLWYDVRIEMPYKVEWRSLARFDVAIFHPKRNIIIEVKKKGRVVERKQIVKYSKFNADLIFCIGKEQIDETIEHIKKNYPL